MDQLQLYFIFREKTSKQQCLYFWPAFCSPNEEWKIVLCVKSLYLQLKFWCSFCLCLSLSMAITHANDISLGFGNPKSSCGWKFDWSARECACLLRMAAKENGEVNTSMNWEELFHLKDCLTIASTAFSLGILFRLLRISCTDLWIHSGASGRLSLLGIWH